MSTAEDRWDVADVLNRHAEGWKFTTLTPHVGWDRGERIALADHDGSRQ